MKLESTRTKDAKPVYGKSKGVYPDKGDQFEDFLIVVENVESQIQKIGKLQGSQHRFDSDLSRLKKGFNELDEQVTMHGKDLTSLRSLSEGNKKAHGSLSHDVEMNALTAGANANSINIINQQLSEAELSRLELAKSISEVRSSIKAIQASRKWDYFIYAVILIAIIILFSIKI